METQTERLVQSNKGDGQPVAAPEEFPTDAELARVAADELLPGSGSDAGQVRETVDSPSAAVDGEDSGTSPVEGDQVQESSEPAAARTGAPEGYEGVPPEL